jgi:hypothetical protein
MATSTALLNAVTTAGSGSAIQQTIPNTSQQYTTLNITASGSFTAVVTVQIAPVSGGPFTVIKTWNISAGNSYTDNFSYNVPYDYYIQASVNSISGVNTTVTVTYVVVEQLSVPASMVFIQGALPVGIPAGNGSTVGLQFTNTTGAFSLTTAVFPTTYANIWLYMPVGAFDGTNPTTAGLYYATMSSTSVGQLYNVTYQPRLPTGLTSANFATTTSARWLTQTTGADITLVDAVIQGNFMGPNGIAESDTEFTLNSSTNAKICKTIFGGVTLLNSSGTTSATLLANTTTQNRGITNSQVSEGIPGYGFSATSLIWSTVDTTVNQTYSITGQLAANTDFIILESAYLTVTQG